MLTPPNLTACKELGFLSFLGFFCHAMPPIQFLGKEKPFIELKQVILIYSDKGICLFSIF